jgi:integrase
MLDIGDRRGEAAGLRLPDLDLDPNVVHGVGKGRRPDPSGAGVGCPVCTRTTPAHRPLTVGKRTAAETPR